MARVVFIGNIPLSETESSLGHIFEQVGHVLNIRIMPDQSTGQHSGFGYCEYHDVATAQSAIRNLNGYSIEGQQLRVGFAGNGASAQDRNQAFHGLGTASPRSLAEVTARTEATLQKIPVEHLHEIMRHLKDLVHNQPAKARAVLVEHPELAVTLLLAQGLFAEPQSQELRALPPSQQSLAAGPPSARGPAGAPSGMAGKGLLSKGGKGVAKGTAWGKGSTAGKSNIWGPGDYTAPAQAPAEGVQTGRGSSVNIPPAQKFLLQQLMKLTPAQIASLPQQQRDQIKLLQAQSALW